MWKNSIDTIPNFPQVVDAQLMPVHSHLRTSNFSCSEKNIVLRIFFSKFEL